ncbi:uncharacterized protein LOC120007110 isoform X2 [Tripterygium wilfordii]|uniref:uncharacterized protein LOC120007110 isoform X2 n=1 Tax=Tripterygium wilfordii TaxID=458696 RepID=UPI0018F83D8D|nr:uncharacterized protein LOC120007110 isoform X2 [Tripterygium wilfordii]
MRMSLLSRPNASSRSSSRKRFFGGGSMEEEERTAKGDDVIVDLDAKLEDLYMGGTMKLVGAVVFRVAIPHPAPHGLFHPPICSLLLEHLGKRFLLQGLFYYVKIRSELVLF